MILLLLLILFFPSGAWSADQTAASCSAANIQSAIQTCISTGGGTVTMPACDYSDCPSGPNCNGALWGNGDRLTLGAQTVDLRLVGSGESVTKLGNADGATAGTTSPYQDFPGSVPGFPTTLGRDDLIMAAGAGVKEIGNFSFHMNTVQGTIIGLYQCVGSDAATRQACTNASTEARIHHITINGMGSDDRVIKVSHNWRDGVILIDHLTMTNNLEAAGIYAITVIGGFDTSSFQFPAQFGTNNGVFIEDSIFEGLYHTVGGFYATRYTFRHNMVKTYGSYSGTIAVESHEGATTAWCNMGDPPSNQNPPPTLMLMGPNRIEVYDNTFEDQGNIYLRGGLWLVTDNTFEASYPIDILQPQGGASPEYPTRENCLASNNCPWSPDPSTEDCWDTARGWFWNNGGKVPSPDRECIRTDYEILLRAPQAGDYGFSGSSYTKFTYPHPLQGEGGTTTTTTSAASTTTTTAGGADYYVRPITGEYGSEDGSDYANAYDGFAGVNWTDCAAGDTLYVCGTFREQLVVGASGSEGSVLTIKKHPSYDAILLGSTDQDSAWTNTGGHIYELGGYTGDVGNIYYNTNTSVTSGTKHTEAECSAPATNLTDDGDFCWEATAGKVYVHSGTGEPSVVWNGIEAPIVTGSLSDDCVVKLEGKDYVTIDGLTVKYFNGDGIRVWYNSGAACDYVTIQNCNVSYGGGKYTDATYTQYEQFGNGINILGSATNINFLNNTVSYVYDCGLGAESGNSGYDISTVAMTNNTLSYNARGIMLWPAHTGADLTGFTISGNSITQSGNGWSGAGSSGATGDKDGIVVLGKSDGTCTCTISGNRIYSNGRHGLQLKKSNLTCTVSGNSIYSNTEEGIYLPNDGAPTVNIYYNLIYENLHEEVRQSSTTGTITLYNNVLYDTVSADNSNLYLSNNCSMTMKNNIVYSTQDPAFTDANTSPSWTANYNLYYRASGTMITYGGSNYTLAQFATYQAATHGTPKQDANSVASNPAFITAGSDFHLQSGSPAIDKGVNVGLVLDYDGRTVPRDIAGIDNADNGTDIGAYEFTAFGAKRIFMRSAEP